MRKSLSRIRKNGIKAKVKTEKRRIVGNISIGGEGVKPYSA